MSESLWRRLTQGARQTRTQADWEHFVGCDWATQIMQMPATDRHFAKQGRSIGRVRFSTGDATLVVYLKRHYQLPYLRGLLACLFPSRSWSPAYEEWDNLHQAAQLGVLVPRAVAAGQFLLPGGRLQSVLAVEELSGQLPLHEAIPLASKQLQPAIFARWKRGLIAEMVNMTRALHDARWFHKDLYFCHFYIAESDCQILPSSWSRRVHLIDLHRLAQHRWTWPWWQAKDLGQLLYSSDVEGVTPRDRLRFWQLYTQGVAKGTLQRLVQWMVQVRARNNRDHNRRKPQIPGAVAA